MCYINIPNQLMWAVEMNHKAEKYGTCQGNALNWKNLNFYKQSFKI